MTYNILPVPKEGISICTLYFLHMLAFQKKKEKNILGSLGGNFYQRFKVVNNKSKGN